MKSPNFLDSIPGSGLYFITSGEVKRAIGKQNVFANVTNPDDRVKRVDKLSEVIQKQVNADLKKKLASVAGQARAPKK
jgi:hypothetical protein